MPSRPPRPSRDDLADLDNRLIHPDGEHPADDFEGWLNRLVREASAAGVEDDRLVAALHDRAGALAGTSRATYRCAEGYTFAVEAGDGVDADHADTCPFCGSPVQLVGVATPADFTRRVVNWLRDHDHDDAAIWTRDNAQNPMNLGPIEVAREEGHDLTPEAVEPVARACLGGFRDWLDSFEAGE